MLQLACRCALVASGTLVALGASAQPAADTPAAEGQAQEGDPYFPAAAGASGFDLPRAAGAPEPAGGQDADAAPSPVAAAAEPTTVRVEGRRKGPAPKAASDYQIEVGQLRDVPRRSAEKLLTLAPGLFLTNYGGEGHPSTIFLRGFDAGEGQDVELSLEGIPLNEPSNPHGHGFADTNFIISGLVERLRVVEGPFDPRQGDFAVAGTAEYALGLEDRGFVTKLGYGSYNRADLSVLWGPHGFGRDTFAGVELSRGDGFGRNRAHQAVRAMGQLTLELDEDRKLSLLASSYATRYDSAGVLRLDDVERGRVPGCGADADEQFFCTYDPNQGGAVQRHLVGLRYEQRGERDQLRAQVFTSLRNLRYRENFTGFELDPRLDGGPQRGDGTEQSYDTVTLGSRGSYARSFSLLERRHEVEVGYVARHDRGDTILRRLRRADGVPYAVDFDGELAISNLGLYGAARFSPFSWLVLRGGLRLDAFVFGVEDRNGPEVDRGGEREASTAIEAFGFAVQPRGGATVLLTPWLSWATSIGVGTRSSDAQALSDGESAPFARVVATETGLVARQDRGEALRSEARLVVFNTYVTNDLVFDERAGRNTPIGASNRFGGTVWGRLTHGPSGLDVATSLTYSEAYLTPEDAGLFELAAGPRLPYVPRWVLRSDLSERRPFSIGEERFVGTAALGLSFVDQRPLPFEQFGIPIGTVDAALRLRWRMLELGAEVTNMFDRRNREVELNYPSNFADPEAPGSRLPARHFVAGAPVQLFGSLTAYLDPSEATP